MSNLRTYGLVSNAENEIGRRHVKFILSGIVFPFQLFLLVLVLNAQLPEDMLAQSGNDTTFKLIVSVGGGFNRNVNGYTVPAPGNDYSAGGLGGSLRIMWHPDHLLMAGLETGYLRISTLTLSSDTADRSVSLNALPMLVVFAMKKYGVELSGGLGLYRYSVSAESGKTGIRAGSYSDEVGYMASLGYSCPFSQRFEVGVDIKAHFIPDRDVTSTLVQLRLSYAIVIY